MYVFQNFSGGDTPGPTVRAMTQNRAPFPPKNPDCALAVT